MMTHGIIVSLIGLIVLVIGYGFDVEVARSLVPGTQQMVFVTALCFVLTGIKIACLNDRSYVGVTRTNALSILILGIISLSGYVYTTDPPAAYAIVGFLLIGVHGFTGWRWPGAVLSVLAFGVLVGHATGNDVLTGRLGQIPKPMAIPAALCFLVCADAIRRNKVSVKRTPAASASVVSAAVSAAAVEAEASEVASTAAHAVATKAAKASAAAEVVAAAVASVITTEKEPKISEQVKPLENKGNSEGKKHDFTIADSHG